jgi:hypothetical protein
MLEVSQASLPRSSDKSKYYESEGIWMVRSNGLRQVPRNFGSLN